jgi:hypothetical protein
MLTIHVNRRKQCNYYTTSLPGQSQLLQGVQDKYIWDHQVGKWKSTTHSAVQEAADRREWVCAELERIDALRYKTMADWEQRTREEYTADPSKKRKRDDEAPAPTTMNPSSEQNHPLDNENTSMPSSKRPKTVSFDSSVNPATEPTGQLPQLSIEPPVELPTPKQPIPDSQSTLSSLSTSTDVDHEARSPAPEPETPLRSNAEVNTTVLTIKNEESTAACLARYTFLLDIPTTDKQRISWLKFLDKYNWNPAIISPLRRFFMADPAPNMSRTQTFLERLKTVCKTIEVESEGQGGGTYKLLWDQKVKLIVDEMAMEAAEEEKVKALRQQRQPKWVKTPDTSPLSSIGKNTPKTPKRLRLTVSPQRLRLTVSPPSARVRAIKSPAVQKAKDVESNNDETSDTNNESQTDTETDIPALMKQYVSSLKKGQKVEPPCDRCRESNVECHINKTSCSRCARRHDRCVWTKVDVDELKGLGLLEKDEAEYGKGWNRKKKQASSGKKRASNGKKEVSGIPGGEVTGKRTVRKRKRSVYDLTGDEDGDETRAFLEDDGSQNASVQAVSEGDGDQTRAFLAEDEELDVDSESEEEWVPSSSS